MCKFYSLNFVIIFQLARFSIGIYFWIVKLNKIQLCIYVSYLKIETFVNKKSNQLKIKYNILYINIIYNIIYNKNN